MSDRQIYDLIRAQVHPLAGAFIVDSDENEIRFPEFVPFERVPTLRRAIRMRSSPRKRCAS